MSTQTAVTAAAADALGRRLWARLCPLLDGLALGALVEALEERGALGELAASRQPQEIAVLAARWGARPGYLHLFLRALAQLGLTHLEAGEDDRRQVTLSLRGRDWLARAGAYRGFSRQLEAASLTSDWLAGRAAAPVHPPALPAAARGDSPIARMIAGHLRGPLVGSLLGAAYRRASGDGPEHSPTAAAVWEAMADARAYAAALFAEQGWTEPSDTDCAISPEGQSALLAAPQFFHTLSYLPTLRRCGDLLFGVDTRPPGRGADGRETHLDRGLDIAFSGLVFRRTCAPGLLAMLAPLFAQRERAPRCIVDVGCGDGTLLLTLGLRLTPDPGRLLVGVDPAPEARERTRAVLTAAGLPNRVFDGDIADPCAIADRLRESGDDLREGLFISKSVFHDRRYQPPTPTVPTPTGSPSRCLFIAEDGDRLPTREVERHLLELLGRWRPWVGRHGMVIIEAHTADPSDAAACAGRHLLVPLEITHGLSHQYLLEAERFRDLVAQAGYVPAARQDLNTWMLGKPLMTMDRYWAKS